MPTSKTTQASLKHIALLEQAVNRYAPRLWRLAARDLSMWLRETLGAARPQVESLVLERRAFEAEVIFLTSILQNFVVTGRRPRLLGLIQDIADQVALQFGFLATDPRRALIVEETRRLLESDLFTWWKNLTSPETLARRIVKLRSEGLSYTAMTNALSAQYRSSFASAERVVRTSYNTAANLAHFQDLARAGYDASRWLSARDQRVRRPRKGSKFDHRSVDGQIRPLGEPFLVSGERLRYPGDRSLGASAGNIIHCRCVLIGVYL